MFSFFLVSVLLGMGAGYFGVAVANARLSLKVTCRLFLLALMFFIFVASILLH